MVGYIPNGKISHSFTHNQDVFSALRHQAGYRAHSLWTNKLFAFLTEVLWPPFTAQSVEGELIFGKFCAKKYK